jgi:hypothetical protein
MTQPSAMVAGLLLCRAADGRIAFHARDVVAVEAWQAELRHAPHARVAFGYSPERGRSLVSATGDAVGVDEVAVFAELTPLYKPPALLERALGGSIQGFIRAQEMLWPLLKLREFSRFLARSEAPK